MLRHNADILYFVGTGDELLYTNFARKNPDRDQDDCIMIDAISGDDGFQWKTQPCNANLSFICEKGNVHQEINWNTSAALDMADSPYFQNVYIITAGSTSLGSTQGT